MCVYMSSCLIQTDIHTHTHKECNREGRGGGGGKKTGFEIICCGIFCRSEF